MLKNKRLKLMAITLFVVAGGAIFCVYAAKRPIWPWRLTQNRSASKKTGQDQKFVRRAIIWQTLRPALNLISDRVERPGKERLLINGVLSEPSNTAQPVQLILEFPDRLQLTLQNGVSRWVTNFNGQAQGKQYDQLESDLIESLIYDSPEHFFLAASEGAALRSLGSRFHGEGPAVYDIYQLADSNNLGRNSRGQTKFYDFNSDTQLLERVRYQAIRDGLTVATETRVGWQNINGRYLPVSIARFENGAAVFTLSISSIAVGPRVDDGVFVTQ
jgi:hypothetical protein